MGTRRDEGWGVHVDWDWSTGPERRSTSGMLVINGIVVKHWSRTQPARALSTAEAEYYAVITGSSGGSPNAVDDDGLGTECTGSCLHGLQRSQGDCVKKTWDDLTCGIEILVAAGGDQIGKSENEPPRRAKVGGTLDEGKTWREINDFIGGVGGRMKVSQGNTGNEHGWQKWQEGNALAAPPSHEVGRVRAVRELNKPWGDEGADGWNMTSSVAYFAKNQVVRPAQGKRGSRNTGGKVKYDVERPPEQCQLQNRARSAPKDSQS